MFLRNYFLDSSKNPGSFVSHIRYCLIFKFLIFAAGEPARDAVSLTAFSICQEIFENFFSEVFEALRASNLPKGFQSPLDPGLIWGSVSGGVTLSRGDLLILPHAGAFVNRKNELRRNR